MKGCKLSTALLSVFLLLVATASQAEPWLAVKEGFACWLCHVNNAGGGQRTLYGNTYAQQSLAVESFLESAEPWTGQIAEGVSIGGNGRFSAREFAQGSNPDPNTEFATDRVSLYGTVALNERITLYIDQQVAPGGSLNREAWGRVNWNNLYVKAGKIFLPFGWRLEDDTAFVRRATGINFNNGDNGFEIGWNHANWQWQLAVTNGTFGGTETDDGKFITSRFAWVSSLAQLGASYGNNNTDMGDRTMVGIFAGLNTGPVVWLAEWDNVKDQGFGPADTEQDIALIEANIGFLEGHNLKLTYEMQDFADAQIDRTRTSIVWEYFPWAFAQFRAGYRKLDADSPTSDEGSETFLQLHFYF